MWSKNRLGAMLYVLILSISIAGASSNSDKKQADTLLLPLMGQKCTVVLKDKAKRVNGTLLDLGSDSVTLKVKKGLLYSKAEKFKFSDVKYIEDEKGKRIDISTLLLQKKSAQEKEEAARSPEKPPMTLYIGMSPREMSLAQPNNNIEPTSAVTPEPAKGGLRTHSGTEPERATEQRESRPNDSQTAAKKTEPTRSKDAGLAGRETPFSTTGVRATARKQNDLKTGDEKGTGKPGYAEVTPNPVIQVVNASGEQKTLKYQHTIFLGVILFIFAAIVLFNLAGLGGTVIDKQHLFPAKLIKIEGKFGVIDHGTNEGVKVNDIVRFHSRFGRQIQYKGKVRVKKVNRTFAAVEVVSKKKHVDLEVGDTGVRDRNVIGNAFEKSRALVSALLAGIAKALAFTSRTIEIKREEPDIDLDRVTMVNEDDLVGSAKTHLPQIAGRTQPRISDGTSRNAPAQTENN